MEPVKNIKYFYHIVGKMIKLQMKFRSILKVINKSNCIEILLI